MSNYTREIDETGYKCSNCNKKLDTMDDPVCDDCGAVVPLDKRKGGFNEFYCTNCLIRLIDREPCGDCGCTSHYVDRVFDR